MGTTSEFESACWKATTGQLLDALDEFRRLLDQDESSSALLLNNLAVVEASLGNVAVADELFERAFRLDSSPHAVKRNRSFLNTQRHVTNHHRSHYESGNRQRIAIVSLLFNWPSTGGGTVHTKELGDFLTRAGYEVCHFYAANASWGVGNVSEPLPYQAERLEFADRDWRPEIIRERFRSAVSKFHPAAVIVTDSWNTKSLLCEAVAAFPYYIRIAALETLCPLNNVRLLVDEQHQPQQCELHQLREPRACRNCVTENQHLSGSLHQAERQLAGFFEEDYPDRLHKAFANAAGVLAVNPDIAKLIQPYTNAVHVVPSGFDEARFPASFVVPPPEREKTRILFAGLTNEYMKGFHVLQQDSWSNVSYRPSVATASGFRNHRHGGASRKGQRFHTFHWLADTRKPAPCHSRLRRPGLSHNCTRGTWKNRCGGDGMWSSRCCQQSGWAGLGGGRGDHRAAV